MNKKLLVGRYCKNKKTGQIHKILEHSLVGLVLLEGDNYGQRNVHAIDKPDASNWMYEFELLPENEVPITTNTSLKGRWVKALINGPVSISSWRQGEYRKITNDDGSKIEGGFAITVTADYCELMPEEFNPNCPINVMDKNGTLLKIGDRVRFEHHGHHSDHKWYNFNNTISSTKEHIITDIDLDDKAEGVLKLDNNAARAKYCTKVMHEFQRGSWYRTIGTQFTTNKYIKFHIFDDAKKVVYSERITHAGEHHTFKAEHNYQRSSIAHPTESLVLVPDEEVAEYINKINNSFPIY